MADETSINDDIAEAFDEIAHLVEVQGGNTFRARSYRRAARELRALDRSVDEILRHDGEEGLRRIPGIGEGLAGAIDEYVAAGRLGLLNRLRGEVSPVDIFQELPGVGPEFAERIHAELGVETLEELEQAAHDGRLAEIEGVGDKTVSGLKDALAGRLGRGARRRARRRVGRGEIREPPVDVVLEVDRIYRQKAEADQLRRIAPRRFNPNHERWLPVMEIERESWSFTVLFSNTKRAHELDKTDDWVVIYYERGDIEGQ
ncbi:MAG: helix-hairpin-helix domain-containing protein, partial [Bradymonadaceae bacterium]